MLNSHCNNNDKKNIKKKKKKKYLKKCAVIEIRIQDIKILMVFTTLWRPIESTEKKNN